MTPSCRALAAGGRGGLVFALFVGLLVGSGGCGEGDDGPGISENPGPLMRAGWNCLASGCHFPDKQAVPPDWGAAGTVFADPLARLDRGIPGVTVRIRDSGGTTVDLVTNEVGNFFTPTALVGPLEIEIEKAGVVRKMPTPAPAGSCNFCHEPEGVAAGRIFL